MFFALLQTLKGKEKVKKKRKRERVEAFDCNGLGAEFKMNGRRKSSRKAPNLEINQAAIAKQTPDQQKKSIGIMK